MTLLFLVKNYIHLIYQYIDQLLNFFDLDIFDKLHQSTYLTLLNNNILSNSSNFFTIIFNKLYQSIYLLMTNNEILSNIVEYFNSYFNTFNKLYKNVYLTIINSNIILNLVNSIEIYFVQFQKFLYNYFDIRYYYFDFQYSDIKLNFDIQYYLYIYYPLIESFKYFILELIKGKWISNFVNLVTILPDIKNSIINEKCFFESQYTNSLTILHLPLYQDNKFFIGCLNGLFLSLPITCSQLICLYRTIIKGPFYGFIGNFGYIFGQCLLFSFVLFGFRPFIISWFSLETFVSFFGIYLVIRFIINTFKKDIIEEKFEYIFITHFLLAWTENSYFFNNLSDLNFNIEPLLLNVFPSINYINHFVVHGSYIFGIFLSFLFLSYFYNKILINFLIKIFQINKKYCKQFIIFMSTTLLLIVNLLTLLSLSYHDLDYILINPLGFSPKEKILSHILLDQNSIEPMPKISGPVGFGDLGSIRIDVFSFHTKHYSEAVEFEELNYRAEYDWSSRNQKFYMPNARKYWHDKYKKRKVFDEHLYFKRDKLWNILVSPACSNSDVFYTSFFNEVYLQNYSKMYTIRNILDSDFKFSFLPRDPYFKTQTNSILQNQKNVKEVERQIEIKQKYYTNFIYKTFLNFETDKIIARQGNLRNYLELEENDLFRRRIALSNYSESNYYYSKLKYFEQFRELFYNSKSYSNNIYNQQYKGTLRVIKNLFPVTLNKNIANRSILKYDFPIFYSFRKGSSYHEELQLLNNNSFLNYKGFVNNIPAPFYLAWNDDLHQLVITNNIYINSKFKNPELVLINESIKNRDKLDNNHLISNELLTKYNINTINPNHILLNTLTIPNLQKINGLSRQSYSILRTPFLEDTLLNSLQYYNNINYEQASKKVKRLRILRKNKIKLRHYYYMKYHINKHPQSSFLNQLDIIDWFGFRYTHSKRAHSKDLHIFLKYMERRKTDE